MSVKYLELGHPEKTVALLDRCLADGSQVKSDAARMEVYALRGVAYERKADPQNSRTDYNRVLELAARCPLADRLKVAERYVGLGQPDKAIVLLNQVIAADATAVKAYALRAAANEAKGDLDDELKDYDRIAQLAPQTPGLDQKRQALKAQLEKMKAASGQK
jgi:tetratricopeptide (TPR) repeat protein